MNSTNKENGFSLIEAMVAMLIVSVTLLALGMMTLGVMRSDNTANVRTIAMNIAEKTLEEWYDIPPQNPPPVNQTDTVTIDNVTFHFQSFDPTPISGINSYVDPTSSASTAEYRAVTVYWKDQSGVHHVTAVNMGKE